MRELAKLGRESVDEAAKGVAAVAVSGALTAMGVPAEAAAYAPVIAGAGYPVTRAAGVYGLRRSAGLMAKLGRVTGLSPAELATEVNGDPELQDMLTLILREMESSTSDPAHMDQLAAVLGFAITNPDNRGDARAVVKVMEGLHSRHIAFLERLSEPPPSAYPSGSNSRTADVRANADVRQSDPLVVTVHRLDPYEAMRRFPADYAWTGDELAEVYGDEVGNWEFAAAALLAAGLVTRGALAESDDSDVFFERSGTVAIAEPGWWALEALRKHGTRASRD